MDGLNSKINDLTKEREKLQKALEEGGDETVKKQLAQANKDLTAIRQQYDTLKGDYDKIKNDHATELLGIQIDNVLAGAKAGLKFKAEFPQAAVDTLLSQAEAKVKGMSPEFLAKVTDPYTTSRTTRKVGLGLPLIKMNTENCGGGMKLTSEVGKGTRLEFWFLHDHWDRPPMGDLTGTLVMLVSQHEDIHFIITYVTDEGEFVFDTDEIKEALGGMSMNDLTIIRYLKEMVAENLEEIHANQ